MVRRGALPALAALALAVPAHVADAQRLHSASGAAPRRAVLDRGSTPAAPHLQAEGGETRYAPPLIFEQRSTLAERFVSGLIVGVVAGLGAAAAVQEDSEGEYQLRSALIYAGASASGVMFATVAREGARPIRTLAGAAAGALPLYLAVGDDFSRAGAKLLVAGVITAPLGAAIGHSIGADDDEDEDEDAGAAARIDAPSIRTGRDR